MCDTSPKSYQCSQYYKVRLPIVTEANIDRPTHCNSYAELQSVEIVNSGFQIFDGNHVRMEKGVVLSENKNITGNVTSE